MNKTPDTQTINSLKKELCDLLIKNDYNLLAPEIIDLSMELDNKLLPIFKKQIDFFNYFNNTPSN